MLTYVAESAASAPPPRGLPFAPPAARASGGNGYVPPALLAGTTETIDEDAQPAFAAPGGAEAAGYASASASGDEDEGPPLEALEAQMSGEVAARDAAAGAARRPVRAKAGDDDDETDGAAASALPEIDALTARLPAEVRETLDELFRARFVSVKRLPKKVFKPASAKAPPTAT